ncbi:MAG: SRPBCC family protein [Pirellulales bacterium]
MAKKILLGTLIAIGVILVAFLAVVAMQPSHFRVERTANMTAPPEAIFAQVNDFQNWGAWSPWAQLDPNAKNTFEGPAVGEGAIFRWAGNDEVGEGSMTILESRPSEFVKIKLAFIKPMEDTATTEFILKPEGEQTAVTWNMYGENNFMAKAFCLFMDMDTMIGDQYEKGLANIKSIVEAKPEPQPPTTDNAS